MNRDSWLYKRTYFSESQTSDCQTDTYTCWLRTYSPLYFFCGTWIHYIHSRSTKCVPLLFSLPSSPFFQWVTSSNSGLTFSLTTFPALAFAAPVFPEGEITKRNCIDTACRSSATVSVGWPQQVYGGLTDHGLCSPPTVELRRSYRHDYRHPCLT